MNFNIQISEEDLENHLIKYIPSYWDMKIIKNQFRIKGGIIDILAKSTEEDNVYYVIELKAGEITPESVCQVLRYTQYMNSEMSKGGKRIFYPLLIGKTIATEGLNGHLVKLLKFFDGYIDRAFYVHYSLYNVDIDGLQLGWYNGINKSFIDDNYELCFSREENLENRIEDLEIKQYMMEKENGK